LKIFAECLESSVIESVKSGFMTKDLAICVKNTNDVARSDYCNTQEYLDKVKEFLDKNWTKAKASL